MDFSSDDSSLEETSSTTCSSEEVSWDSSCKSLGSVNSWKYSIISFAFSDFKCLISLVKFLGRESPSNWFLFSWIPITLSCRFSWLDTGLKYTYACINSIFKKATPSARELPCACSELIVPISCPLRMSLFLERNSEFSPGSPRCSLSYATLFFPPIRSLSSVTRIGLFMSNMALSFFKPTLTMNFPMARYPFVFSSNSNTSFLYPFPYLAISYKRPSLWRMNRSVSCLSECIYSTVYSEKPL